MIGLISIVLVVAGLCLFEIINSIDNAIVNAEVLSTMSKRARKWFLFWGILFAVFIIRGLLPWILVYFTMPSLGFFGSLTATFSSDPKVIAAIASSAPILLMGAGVFLVFLFFHWLFIEDKNYGFIGEKFIHRQSVWFYAVVSVILSIIVWDALQISSLLAFGAVIGSTVFFIVHGFRQNAEKAEKDMLKGHLSDLSKLFYLEVLDATFSMDGVLGAFAFTLSIPLILIGNGIGAVVVRQITVGNIENVKKYLYLKNGAMYSIFFLGFIMIMESFGHEIPMWVSPVITFGTVGFFYYKSHRHLKRNQATKK